MSYYKMPGDILKDAAAFCDWARQALAAASRVKKR